MNQLTPPIGELLGVISAAKILDVCPATLRTYAVEGKIPSAIIGRKRRFRREDIDRFISRQFTD